MDRSAKEVPSVGFSPPEFGPRQRAVAVDVGVRGNARYTLGDFQPPFGSQDFGQSFGNGSSQNSLKICSLGTPQLAIVAAEVSGNSSR